MTSDESDVKEEVVFVELNGLIDQEWPHVVGQACKIIGIDSDNPILQLGRTVFSGEYRDTLGTKVLFECNSEETQSDGAVLDYAMCVNKVLHMQRVFLTERETGDASSTMDGGSESKEDPSVATSSSLATDAAVSSSSDPQADRSDEVILPTQTVMDTSD